MSVGAGGPVKVIITGNLEVEHTNSQQGSQKTQTMSPSRQEREGVWNEAYEKAKRNPSYYAPKDMTPGILCKKGEPTCCGGTPDNPAKNMDHPSNQPVTNTDTHTNDRPDIPKADAPDIPNDKPETSKPEYFPGAVPKISKRREGWHVDTFIKDIKACANAGPALETCDRGSRVGFKAGGSVGSAWRSQAQGSWECFS